MQDSIFAQVNEIYLRGNLPALSIAYNKYGQTTYFVKGYTKVRNGNHVKVSSPFHIGSCFKSMFCLFVTNLVEKGILDWNLPLLNNIETNNKSLSKIKLIDLLSHLSGIRENINESDLWLELYSISSPSQVRKFVIDNTLPSLNVDNYGVFHYSNFGYVLAAYLIEVTLGDTFENLFQKYFVDVLNLESFFFNSLNGETPIFGHKENQNNQLICLEDRIRTDNPTALNSAGRAFCNIQDYNIFLKALVTEDYYVSKESLNFIFSESHELSLGWLKNDFYNTGNIFFMNRGSNGSWLSQSAIFDDLKSSAAIFTNCFSASGSHDVDEVMSILVDPKHTSMT